ncbi:class I SAM-dependent methyltransferase, partial [Burkholderia pseudomallei]
LSMVVSRATLHHLPDKALSLAEMFRVLRPGGVGVVHDMRRDAPPALLERFTQMRAAANYPPTHLEEKVTLDEARELVAAAGLAEHASVTSPPFGLGALGFEILLTKPGEPS